MTMRERGGGRISAHEMPSPEKMAAALRNSNVLRLVPGLTNCIDPRENTIALGDDSTFAEIVAANRGNIYIENAPAIPGATIGLLMPLLAAYPDLSPEAAGNAIRNWERINGRTPTIHTDNIHEPGCGHLGKALAGEPGYGVSRERLEAGVKALTTEEINTPRLADTHREVAVVLVDSPTFTIPYTIGIGNFEYPVFRVDLREYGKRLKDLANYLTEQGVVGDSKKVISEKLIQSATDQLLTTAGLLAKNLPVFHVKPKYGERENEVEPAPANLREFIINRLKAA